MSRHDSGFRVKIGIDAIKLGTIFLSFAIDLLQHTKLYNLSNDT